MLGSLSRYRQARQASQGPHRTQLVLVSLGVLGLVAGCYWLKYGRLMSTHVELMLSMTDKLSRLLTANEPVTPATMKEMGYPLERARDFVRIVGDRYAGRTSLRRFRRFLDTYATLTAEADRLRTAGRDQAHFHALVATLHQEAAQVESALAEER